MYIVPRNMCTKFHLKMLNVFLSYEVRFKFCDDANADNDDEEAKAITIAQLSKKRWANKTNNQL